MSAGRTQFWVRHGKWWPRIAAPLRPQASDVALLRPAVEGAARATGRLRALLLGVTPEYAGMAWPDGTELTAVDKSATMIEQVWPQSEGLRPAAATAVQGDWLALPLDDDGIDVVVGDGCFSQVAYPQGAERLGRELARVLAPGGQVAMRTFVRPDRRRAPDELFARARQRAYPSFHAFKWCLNMAMQPSVEEGVRLHDVWEAVTRCQPASTWASWAGDCGWSPADVETIEAYRDVEARFHYPTRAELHDILSGIFRTVVWMVPSYPLGERCPHVWATPPGPRAREAPPLP